jgi:hypothetical protein
VVLPGVGHVPQLEAPQECAAAIIGWLGQAEWVRDRSRPAATGGG